MTTPRPSLFGIGDLLVLRRDSNGFDGKVKNKYFDVVLESGQRIRYKTSAIDRIVYRNPPYFPDDSIQLLAGGWNSGEITTTPIVMEISGDGTARFAKKEVAAILFFSNASGGKRARKRQGRSHA